MKCRGDREIRGRLHAYDQHLNMVLSEVEEISYVREELPGKARRLRFGPVLVYSACFGPFEARFGWVRGVGAGDEAAETGHRDDLRARGLGDPGVASPEELENRKGCYERGAYALGMVQKEKDTCD